jgi:hypothetical protein
MNLSRHPADGLNGCGVDPHPANARRGLDDPIESGSRRLASFDPEQHAKPRPHKNLTV